MSQPGVGNAQPRLSAVQFKQIEQGLKRGSRALGYATGLWTVGRVRKLIERQCGGYPMV